MLNLFDFDYNGVSQNESQPFRASNNLCEEVVVHGKKYHNCTFPNCGKTFRFKSEFLRHKVIHVVQRPYNCPHQGCNKTFKREDALKNHVRIHTGEMPFACEAEGCDARFTTKAGLRYHLLKHKGEKMCCCSYPGCGKSFLTMAQLKQHENASNFHKRISNQMPETPFTESTMPTLQPMQVAMPSMQMEAEQETYDEIYKPLKDKDFLFDEFFVPEMKPVQTLEWETKDQFEDNDDDFMTMGQNNQESFDNMMKNIMKENSALKQKLNMCQTLMDLMQENNELRSKLGKAPNPMSSTSVENDDKIFKFLNLGN